MSKEKKKEKKVTLHTCTLKKYRFNLYFIRLIYTHDVLKLTWQSPFKFGDLFATDQDEKYIGFCPKMLVITTKRHKPGVFWALLKQVQYAASILEGIRNLNFGSILLKKYFIQMRYVKMLLKYTYIVLKRAYLVYRSVGLQMMRFFFYEILI